MSLTSLSQEMRQTCPPEPLWRRFLRQIIDRRPAEPAMPAEPKTQAGRNRRPVYRITRIWENHWVVVRPRSPVEHVFHNRATAEAFVRHDAGDFPATIELCIDDLYVTAQHDPKRPALFGDIG